MATLNVMTASDLANLIPEKWDRRVRDDRIQREFFSKFEGEEGGMSAIITKNDFRKEPGDTIHMETLSELYSNVTSGESTLEGSEEKITNHQFDVTIELYRHAVAITRKAAMQEIINSINRASSKLGRYFAKLYDEFIFEAMINSNVATLGTAQASLDSSDRLTPDVLDEIALGCKRRGMLPIEASAGDPFKYQEVFAVVMDEVSAYHLQTNSTFRQTIRSALPRGTDNPMFTGALGMWNNLILYTYSGIHQGCHQGTPQRPEVAISTAASAGDTTLTVGSNSDRDYTKHFPTSGTLVIMADGTNATEEVTYTGTTNNTFTGVSALSKDHLVGTRVVQQGHMSTLVAFGAEAVARAWGEKDKPIAQVRDYGMERGVGLESVTGVARIEDSAGNVPNILNYRVYADLPNLTSITL